MTERQRELLAVARARVAEAIARVAANAPPATKPTAAERRAQRDVVTRALWAELHARPSSYDPATEQPWFDKWLARVPCGECRLHAKEILKQLSPDFSTPERYYAFGVAFHNEVNKLRGVPEWTG